MYQPPRLTTTVWPVPYACAQPYHPGSGSHGELFRPYWGSSAWHSRRAKERGKTPCMKDPSLPRRVQSTPWSKQVVAVGTCASMQLLGIVSKDWWCIRSGRACPVEENWLSSERNKKRTQTAVINIVNFCIFIETWGFVCRVKIHFQKCQKWLIQVVLKSSRSLES